MEMVVIVSSQSASLKSPCADWFRPGRRREGVLVNHHGHIWSQGSRDSCGVFGNTKAFDHSAAGDTMFVDVGLGTPGPTTDSSRISYGSS